MKISTIITGLCSAMLLLVVPSTAEASTALWDYVPRNERFDRPTTRSIQATGRAYWSDNAALRRRFMRQLERIEEKKDDIVPEYTITPTPQFSTGTQGFVPYNHWRTRRHVRHLHWQNLLRIAPEVRRGEGSAAQAEEEVTEESDS